MEGISLDEAICLQYGNYLQLKLQFCWNYRSLLNRSVIDGGTLTDIFAPDFVEEPEEPGTALNDVAEFVMAHQSELVQWVTFPGQMNYIMRVASDPTNGVWSVAYWLYNQLVENGADELSTLPVSECHAFIATAVMLTLLHHAMDLEALTTPPLYLGTSAEQASVTLAHLAGKTFPSDSAIGVLYAHARSRAAGVAHSLMQHVLVSLPMVVPREPSGVLYLREHLAGELSELREVIELAANDLADSASPETIRHEANKRFVQPVNALRRRLAHPTRDLMRNVITSSLLGASVTLAAGPMLGLPLTATALIGLSVDLLSAALKTRIDRERRIDESPVAFLMRAELSR